VSLLQQESGIILIPYQKQQYNKGILKIIKELVSQARAEERKELLIQYGKEDTIRCKNWFNEGFSKGKKEGFADGQKKEQEEWTRAYEQRIGCFHLIDREREQKIKEAEQRGIELGKSDLKKRLLSKEVIELISKEIDYDLDADWDIDRRKTKEIVEKAIAEATKE
jgi:hypothetical protein